MDATEIIFTMFCTIIGLFIGSFLNVCIYRIPQKNFFKESRSYCPHCNTTLQWFELVPVFSFLFLKGKCRTCKAKISPRYPIVELLNCILYCLISIKFGLSIYSAVFMLLCSALIVMSFIDLDTMEIPNGLVLFLIIIGIAPFVYSFFGPYTTTIWWEHLIGAVCISGLLFIISVLSRGGIGAGDVKLMFAVGFILGYKLVIVSALFGIIIGAIIGISVLIINKKSNGKTQIPFGPSLALGSIIAVFFGSELINWYLPLMGL